MNILLYNVFDIGFLTEDIKGDNDSFTDFTEGIIFGNCGIIFSVFLKTIDSIIVKYNTFSIVLFIVCVSIIINVKIFIHYLNDII